VNGPASRLLVSVAAGAVAAIACRSLARVTTGSAWSRRNFRGVTVSLVAGPVLVAVAAAGLLLLAVADADGRRGALAMLVAVVGAGAVGWYDDAHGEIHAKGLHGHARLLVRGRVSSGVLKVAGLVAVGTGVAVIARPDITGFAVVDAVVVAGAANLVNLFDLRPGRAIKIALLTAVPLVAVLPSAAGAALAVPAGVAAGVLPFDVRERVMLGDCGANALGAALGAGVAIARNATASLVVLAAIVAMTLASEMVSYSRIIDATGPLRAFDRLGRLPDTPLSSRHD
jgi:UDP-N-acetylmuramyl pentapeptide phosphotransferase/UDP-N-acetylglucosamine-1-phosphate transferase